MTMAIYPDLKNKMVLVTGATRGIGHEVALALAHQGAQIVFNYRLQSEQMALALKSTIEDLGGKAYPLQFDMGKPEEIQKSLEAFLKEGHLIEGVVNNAGVARDQLIMRLSLEDLDETLNVNLKGAFYIMKVLSRSLLKVPAASIVNISSVVGLMGNSGQSAYSASKAGLIGLTKSLAKELASKNIRCNAICPGFITTDMTASLPEKVKEHYLSEIPLKRMGSGSEVANLVAFLLSSASSYITGEVIKIDGGLYI